MTSLKDEIVRHIFVNLGINLSNARIAGKSLTDKEFLLKETLKFDIDGQIVKNKVWGCQMSVSPQNIKILLADCSEDVDCKEFSLLVQLQDNPAYGLFINEDYDIDENMLAIHHEGWLECSTYLQATFLAGMEQTKEIGMSWTKCQDYSSQYSLLIDFIKFHSLKYER